MASQKTFREFLDICKTVELDEILMITPPTKSTKSTSKSTKSSGKPHPSNPNYPELMRKWAKEQERKEEIENFDEGIGTSIVSSPLFKRAPYGSTRGRIRRGYLLRKTLDYAKKSKEKPVSGRAADPNVPIRGPRARNSGNRNV